MHFCVIRRTIHYVYDFLSMNVVLNDHLALLDLDWSYQAPGCIRYSQLCKVLYMQWKEFQPLGTVSFIIPCTFGGIFHEGGV